MIVLVTAFDPFGGETVNPALEAVRRLQASQPEVELVKCELPTIFGEALLRVEEAIRRYTPDLVIAVGQAGGRSAISVERVAINQSDASIPDNAGAQPIDEVIVADGPAAYFATLPIKAIVATLKAHGIPAEVSNSAGTFVCNHVMYGVLHHLAVGGTGARGGFIHVPYTPEQAVRRGGPSMELERMVEALDLAIQACIEHPTDRVIGGGAIA